MQRGSSPWRTGHKSGGKDSNPDFLGQSQTPWPLVDPRIGCRRDSQLPLVGFVHQETTADAEVRCFFTAGGRWGNRTQSKPGDGPAVFGTASSASSDTFHVVHSGEQGNRTLTARSGETG